MCTVSWLQDGERFELFFNRDERRTRRPALPPEIRSRRNTRFIAPADGDFGGSWIGVNELGLVLGLLNGYSPRDLDDDGPGEGFTSRGLLLTGLIDGRSVADVLERLDEVETSRFRSFVLAVFEPPHGAALVDWDRRDLRVISGGLEVVPTPLVSSSYSTEEVRRSRARLLDRMRRDAGGDSARLRVAYHTSHEPTKGPHAVCMHRPDAKTVSFSHVLVDRTSVRLRYAPHSPCRGVTEAPRLELPRIVARAPANPPR